MDPRGPTVSRLGREPEVERLHGLPLATAPETLLAVARDFGVLDLVAMADSALRAGHCTLDRLSEAAGQRRRGAPRLREVLPLLDPRSESPWESIMRTLHRAAGIEVEPQYEVFDANRRLVDTGWQRHGAGTGPVARPCARVLLQPAIAGRNPLIEPNGAAPPSRCF